jgi:hypothetical protein
MTKAPAKKTAKLLEPKKPAAKAKAPAPAKKPAKEPSEAMYTMSQDVKDWIERAQSIMNHQRGQIERLTLEIKELKAYKKWAEHRILRSDYE